MRGRLHFPFEAQADRDFRCDRDWKSKAQRAYQRRTQAADALIASVFLPDTNTRRMRRATATLVAGAIGKDVVSRTWRKVNTGRDACNARSLAEEPIMRLILDGTMVRDRLDRKATSLSLLVIVGVPRMMPCFRSIEM
ncbi:hypothetical protein BSQ44_24395 [Aquibium oceanicum]|uniref:Mutator family transposase n=1 Tax=Aquibium oceanicum TaxID=1670800 RepID=A0A1L3SXW7_9HYPH|nr:hypothetical protein BSQ44_24395 [Aquibium oceanicum]